MGGGLYQIFPVILVNAVTCVITLSISKVLVIRPTSHMEKVRPAKQKCGQPASKFSAKCARFLKTF